MSPASVARKILCVNLSNKANYEGGSEAYKTSTGPCTLSVVIALIWSTFLSCHTHKSAYHHQKNQPTKTHTKHLRPPPPPFLLQTPKHSRPTSMYQNTQTPPFLFPLPHPFQYRLGQSYIIRIYAVDDDICIECETGN